MDDVYTYYLELPEGIDEVVMPCLGGYTVYIDPRLSTTQQEEAYKHAMAHIVNNDFEKYDVAEIENERRRSS